jgi:ribosomal protein S12 methylthiotransferase
MKFYVHKLGCPKNDVDADYISARLIADGHTPVTNPDEAETIIVNTCGFILPAKEESVTEILRMSMLKGNGKLRRLYASGCLSQRYGDELLAEISELDGAFGVGALEALAHAMGSSGRIPTPRRTEAERLSYIDWKDRHISDDSAYAYLKISDGCNRICSFCAIPSIRGSYRSRPIRSIVEEATRLAAKGKREIILVSQEATLYGHDLRDGVDLVGLLKELEKIEGLTWIRLLYLYPTQLDEELIDYLISDDNKTLKYFDLPLQHINDDMLKKMQRGMTREKIESILQSIRTKSGEATIRTTFLVGFPGETEDRFRELRGFVAAFGFDRLGVFTYSLEEGTPAASFENQVSEKRKAERMDELMTLQQEIAMTRNNSLIGSVEEVIIDAVLDAGKAVGRTKSDCPDIDQEVYVSGETLKVGDICAVRITGTEAYDLTGIRVRDRR